MSKLEFLIIHCTETPENRPISMTDIINWHTNPKSKGGRGWSRVGYSDMIYLDGSLHNLTPFNQDSKVDNWEMTWGAKGFNGRSRHMVYVGGLELTEELVDPDNEDQDVLDYCTPGDTRTPKQLYTMEVYVRYMIARHPDIKVGGHNQFSNKACHCFNVTTWLRSIGIDEKNIYNG